MRSTAFIYLRHDICKLGSGCAASIYIMHNISNAQYCFIDVKPLTNYPFLFRRSEGFAVDKLTGLSTPNNGVDPLTCGFCWYQEKEVPFNLQELCQWQRAFLDNDVVLHVRNMQRVKSA